MRAVAPATAAAVSALAAGLLACADEPPPPPPEPARLAPEVPASFADPSWSAVGDADPVVAVAGGAPIPRSRIEAALASEPAQTRRFVLDRLIELEVLAQEAVRRGAISAPAPRSAWIEALAQVWLRERFERDVTPDDISDEEVRRLYQVPAIRKLYDHEDAWRMAHLMIGCCDAMAEDCSKEEVQRCFQEAAGPIHEVWREVKARAAGIEGDPEKVMKLMMDYRAEVETRLPQLAYRDRAFYYDPEKPHSEQKGYNILNETVARVVVEAPLAVLQPPVQSAFGWHILVQLDHIPESRKGPDDPEVAADIRKNAFASFREAKFRERLEALSKAHGAVLFPETLGALGP